MTAANGFVNMLWDYRPGQNRFAGIVAQEYSPEEKKLIGERVNIFKGTPLGLTEAPHLYKRDGCYYLLTAEGGTAWNHAVTMARSRNLLGPYELHPDTYIPQRPQPARRAVAARRPCRPGGDARRRNLHGLSLRPAAAESRPLHPGPRNRDPENGMAQDGWLYTEGEPGCRSSRRLRPNLAPHPFPPAPERDDFDAPDLAIDFQWLRTPWPQDSSA